MAAFPNPTVKRARTAGEVTKFQIDCATSGRNAAAVGIAMRTLSSVARKVPCSQWPIMGLLFLWLALTPDVRSAEPITQPLTQARRVLNLTPVEAERAWPVHLRGVVTCHEGDDYLFFVQDETAGIYVLTTNTSQLFQPGQRVEIKGHSDAGSYSPMVVLETIEVVGEGPLPAPRRLAVEQLADGGADCQWVELEGVVQDEREYAGQMILELVSGSSRLRCLLLEVPTNSFVGWVGSRVRMQGVAGTRYNNKRQFTSFQLLIPRTNEITVLAPGLPDPFTAEVSPCRSVMAYSPKGLSDARVRVQGVVTFQRPGQSLYIKDESGGLHIQTAQTSSVPVGAGVDVVGFPARGDFGPVLRHGIFRVNGLATATPPVAITIAQALSGDYESELVSVEGTLLQSLRELDGQQTLVLEKDQRVFRALLPSGDAGGAAADWREGSRLRLTGICELHALSENALQDKLLLWLRTPSDVVVLQRPPSWWTARLLWVGALLAVVVVGGLAWVTWQRQRVRRQTEAVRRREAALDERYHELFENANDIIFTCDLDGQITSVNKAAEAILGYTREESLGMRTDQLAVPEQREAPTQMLKRKLAGEAWTIYELTLLTKTGRRVVLEVNTRLDFQEGRPVGVKGVARDITARKQAEEALRQSEQQLRSSLAERERLGRDLHDGIIQTIYAIGLGLGESRRLVYENPAATEVRLARTITDLNTVIRDVRNFIVGLEPEVLKGQELKGALRSLVMTMSETNAARFSFDVEPRAADRLTNRQATQLLQIAREAMSNSLRHARANGTVVSLALRNGCLQLAVEDDGIGFDKPALDSKGHGLRNIAARASELGGSSEIVSSPGAGTRVLVTLPLEPAP